MTSTPVETLLANSSVTPEFRAALASFIQRPSPNHVIGYNAVSPPVKVLRVISKLLASNPEWEVERLHVEGHSGCSDYHGMLDVWTRGRSEPTRVQFTWDCKVKAEEMGWVDSFGMADQIRAARTFGWDCFQRWQIA